MPRSLVLGNGTLLATFDANLQMRDFYYPHVGMEDQTTYQHVHRVGVFVEGRGFAWWDDPSWVITPQYEAETLVGKSTLRNEKLGLQIIAQDYVHPVHNVLVRHLTVRSLDEHVRSARFFFHHDFHIYGDKQKDTAFYEPYTNSVIHYRQNRYFLVGGETSQPIECRSGVRAEKYASVLRSMEQLKTCGITAFAIGKSEYRGLEGTWKDAEDGELGGNPIEQGSVDSTVGIWCSVGTGADTDVTLWLCAGKSLDDVLQLQQKVLQETPERLQRNCRNFWKSWANKVPREFGSLSPQLIELYKRSLLVIRTHADEAGGIVAAADNDIQAFNRDTYTYVWPRDGAFVSVALDHAGYSEVARKFYRFCMQIQMPDGYLLHKYNPDGSLGSSWHPWFRDHQAQLPIQEDETALVLYGAWKHFQVNHDFEFLQDFYENFGKKAAQFLVDFREAETGLPLPSYDPWEEHSGIFTYTTACAIAGLHAAGEIAHILGHHRHSEHYQTTADEMRQAMFFHLFDEDTKRFMKKIKRKDGKTVERDTTLDASIVAVWLLGVLPPDDPRVISTMEQLEKSLTVRTPVGGLARYPLDFYQTAVPHSAEIPGNPWIITTLWLAQWQIACAKTAKDLAAPKAILEWVNKNATKSGLLPEQLHPITGAHLSVSPLIWSHATYVETVLKFVEKEKNFTE